MGASVMGASVMVGDLMAVADVAALWAEAEKRAERARRRKTKNGEADGPDADRSVRATQERANAGGGARATQEVTGKRLGEVAEAAFLAKASDLGFGVAKPWGDSDPYDFIVETGGRLWKVQVKSAHRAGEDGSYSFRAHGHSLRAYRADEIDALVAYVVPENAWYVFPVKVVRLLRSLKLFTGSRKRRSKFEKYREAWWILRGEGGS
jgi:PD-(D/E)XK endonuclease